MPVILHLKNSTQARVDGLQLGKRPRARLPWFCSFFVASPSGVILGAPHRLDFGKQRFVVIPIDKRRRGPAKTQFLALIADRLR